MQENKAKYQGKTEILVCFYVKAGVRPNSILDQSFELVVLTKI